MFIFEDNPTFEWPIKISLPNKGDYLEFEITGIFRIVDDAEFMAIPENVNTPSEGVDAEIDKLSKVFLGWKDGDVTDVHKEPVEATPANVRRFLAMRPHRMAVTSAYTEGVTPVHGYRAKN